MAKKALLLLLILFTSLTFYVGVVNAQPNTTPPSNSTETTPPTNTTPPANTTSEDPVRKQVWGPSYDSSQMEAYKNAIKADNCATPSLECLVHQTSRFIAIEWVNSMIYNDGQPYAPGEAPAPGETSSMPSSVIGGLGYLINAMYQYPPAKTSIFVADILDSAHMVPRAYAQGLGFSALSPILELWKAFRNVAYTFFIVIIVIIGFMIMFKQKIGGQTAVTAQQAIPSVVVSLIFVTFSYAIAGLLIDFMYLFMYMIIGIFGVTAPGVIDGRIIDYDIFTLMAKLFVLNGSTLESGFDITGVFFSNLSNSSNLGGFAGLLGGLTLTVVITIAILIGTFRLFFELLKSYASIIASVVLSPITLMTGAIPGRSNVFYDWIWDLIGNLSVFPTVLVALVLYYQFTKVDIASYELASGNLPMAITTQAQLGGFLPPFLLNGANQQGLIGSLMGLAIILGLPEIVKEIRKNAGAKDGGIGFMVANAALRRANEGWRGGELVEGLGWSNTKNIPFFGSGKQTAATSMSVGSALRGGVTGYAKGLLLRDGAVAGGLKGFSENFKTANRNYGNIFGFGQGYVDKKYASSDEQTNKPSKDFVPKVQNKEKSSLDKVKDK